MSVANWVNTEPLIPTVPMLSVATVSYPTSQGLITLSTPVTSAIGTAGSICYDTRTPDESKLSATTCVTSKFMIGPSTLNKIYDNAISDVYTVPLKKKND